MSAGDPQREQGPREDFEPESVWQLAWPAVTLNLLHSTVGMVDMKVVGVLGAQAVAGVTTGHRIFFVLQAVLMAVTAGTTALVARAWGAGDRDEAERVNRAGLGLCIAIALAMSLPGLLFAPELAGIFRLTPAARADAATFIWWLSLFNVAFAVSFAIGTGLRAAGDTRTPLWIGAATNVVNVALLLVLVPGGFGIPPLGVAGAAIANGLAFSFGSLLLLLLWWRGSLRIGVGPPRAFERRRIRELVHIGYPAGLEQAVWQGGFIAFLWLVSLYGDAPYAAYGIGVNILSFSFVVGFGFSIAASTLVGQHLGAGDPAGAAHAGWRAVRLSMLAMVILAVVIVAFSEQIARFLIADAEVVRLTVVFIFILGAVQPLMAVEFALGGALRGAGDTRFPLITVTSGLFGARVLLASVFAWLGLPVEWIFGALIADYIVKASMLTLRFRGGRWETLIDERRAREAADETARDAAAPAAPSASRGATAGGR